MRSCSVIAVLTAGAVLVLTGCSTPSGAGSDTVGVTSSQTDTLALAAASPVATDGSPAVITTVGTGKVRGTPDLMTVSLGVQTQASTATEALNQNNTLATDVIAVIKAAGVDPADLQTSDLNLSPTYDDKGQVITGYQVTNTVRAVLRDIAGAGALIDAVAQKAGNAVRVQQVSFSIDDDSALRAAARATAVTQAKAQATQLATAAGVGLGAISSVTEITSSTPLPYYPGPMADTAAAGAVPVEVGSQELSVSVQVVYLITQ